MLSQPDSHLIHPSYTDKVSQSVRPYFLTSALVMEKLVDTSFFGLWYYDLFKPFLFLDFSLTNLASIAFKRLKVFSARSSEILSAFS